MSDQIKLLIVDDIKPIIKSIESVLSENNPKPKVESFHFDLESFHPDRYLEGIEKNVLELKKVYEKFKPNYLCLDRGYSVKREIGDKLYSIYDSRSDNLKTNIIDIFKNYIFKDYTIKDEFGNDVLQKFKLLNNEEDEEKQLKGIYLHTFDPFELDIFTTLDDFRSDFEKYLEKEGMSKDYVDLKYIETSTFFNKPEDQFFYKGWKEKTVVNGIREISDLKTIKEYGTLVGKMFNEYVQEKVSLFPNGGKRSFNNPTNLSFIKFKRIVADKFSQINFTHNSKNQTINLRLGSLSFYDENLNLALDIPYKDYYKPLDHVIDKNELLTFFKNKDNPKLFMDGLNFVYFEFYLKNRSHPKESDFKDVYISDYYYSGENEIEGSVISEEPVNYILQWLGVLFSAVYYVNEGYLQKDGSWKPFRDYIKIIGKDELIKLTNHKKINEIPIRFFLFYHSVEEDLLKGSMNYCFYNENFEGDISSESINIIAKKIYNEIRPLVEAKAKSAWFPDVIKSRLDSATRAAISQVMARNMSHNIGAHVMNKLVDKEYLESFNSSKLKAYNTNIVIDNDDSDNFSQISLYNNYVKCRMDYLSDLSFGSPLMQSTKYVFNDLYKNFDKVRLLLDNISGLGNNFQFSIEFQKNGFKIDESNDFQLAIPNDILGTQAFYNVIENVIRNTAKYTDKQTKEDCKFIINFTDISPEEISAANYAVRLKAQNLICVEIYDTIDLSKRESKQIQLDSGDISSVSYSTWLVNQQNMRLNDSIIYNNQLRTSSLGLIEMDASAAYLRKMEINCIDKNEYQIESNSNIYNSFHNINILKAIKIKGENNKCHLGYRFFMLKPQEVLIVTEESFSYLKVEELRKEGVWIIGKEEFVTHMQNNGVYNHQFIIHKDLDSLEITVNNTKYPILDYCKSSLPLRIIREKDLNSLLNKSSYEIIDYCWGKLKNLNFCEKASIGNSYNKRVNYSCVLLDHLNSDIFTPVQQWNSQREAYYVEALSSNAQSRLPFFNNITCNIENSKEKLNYYLNVLNDKKVSPNISLSKDSIKQMLFESIDTNIIVIDERIQEATSKDYMGVSFKDLYDKMHVYIPGIDINLSESNFNNSIKESIKHFIDKYIGDSNFKSSFILIHYSILERMFNNETNRRDLINEYLDLLTKNLIVVVTSGRGIPEGLSNKVRFVNLSSVLTSFVEFRSKYMINFLFNSARKSNRT